VVALERAEELAPGDPAPSVELADLYLDTGDLVHARATADRARRRGPDDPRVVDLLRRIDEGG
jgi:Flp pilus assembly protein TadD